MSAHTPHTDIRNAPLAHFIDPHSRRDWPLEDSHVCWNIELWRLFLSPLASFPGLKFTALTLWYECGMYIWKIGEVHEKYVQCLNI